MKDLIYLWRTEANESAKAVLKEMLLPRTIAIMQARYRKAINFLQLGSADVENACLKAFDQVLERYDLNRKDASSPSSYMVMLAIRQMQAVIHAFGNASEMNFTKKVFSYDANPLLLNSPQTFMSDANQNDPSEHNLFPSLKKLLALAPLSVLERQIVIMKMEGLKNREIAKMLELPPKSIANHYENAKRKMRKVALMLQAEMKKAQAKNKE